MILYMLEESLGVLLLLAVSTTIIFLFAVAFVLVQTGIRRAVLWAKTVVIRPAVLSPKTSR